MANDDKFLNTLTGEEKKLMSQLFAIGDNKGREAFFEVLTDKEKSMISKLSSKKSRFDEGGLVFKNGSPFDDPLQQVSLAFELGKLPNDKNIQKRFWEKHFGSDSVREIKGQFFIKGADNNYYPARSKGGIIDQIFKEPQGRGNLGADVTEFISDMAEGAPRAGKLATEIVGGALGGAAGGLIQSSPIGTAGLGALGAASGASIGSSVGGDFGQKAGGIIGGAAGLGAGIASAPFRGAAGAATGIGVGTAIAKTIVDAGGVSEALKQGLINQEEAQEFLSNTISTQAPIAGAAGAAGGLVSGPVAQILKNTQLGKSLSGFSKATLAKLDKELRVALQGSAKDVDGVVSKLRKMAASSKKAVNEEFKLAGKEINFNTDSHKFIGDKPKGTIDITDIVSDLETLADNPDIKPTMDLVARRLGSENVGELLRRGKVNDGELFTIFKTLDEFNVDSISKIDTALTNNIIKKVEDKLSGTVFSKARNLHRVTLDTFGRPGSDQTGDLAKLTFSREGSLGKESSQAFAKRFFSLDGGGVSPESRKLAGNLLDENAKKSVLSFQKREILSRSIGKKAAFNVSDDILKDANFTKSAEEAIMQGDLGRNILTKSQLPTSKLEKAFGLSDDVLDDISISKANEAALSPRQSGLQSIDAGAARQSIEKNLFGVGNSIEDLLGKELPAEFLQQLTEADNLQQLAANSLRSGQSELSGIGLQKVSSGRAGQLLGESAGLAGDVLNLGGVPTANFLRSSTQDSNKPKFKLRAQRNNFL